MERDFEYDLATEFEDRHLRCPLSGGECDRKCAFLQKRNLVIDAAVHTGYTLDGRKEVMRTRANVLTEFMCGYIHDDDGCERVPSFIWYSPNYIKNGVPRKNCYNIWKFNIVDRKGLGKLDY